MSLAIGCPHGKHSPQRCDACRLAASEAQVTRLREELAAKDAEASHYRKEFLSADGYLTLTRADLAAARLFLAEARGLLQRWQRWQSDGTEALRLDTDAFLAPPVPTPPLATPSSPGFKPGDVVHAAGTSERVPTSRVDHLVSETGAAPPPPCASWCGCLSADQPRQSSSYMTALPRDNRLHSFCTCDCMLAGAPRNPEKPCELLAATGYTCATSGLKSRCPSCTPGAKP